MLGDDDAPREPFIAETQDISGGGALVRTEHELDASQRVRVEMESDDPPLSIETTAMVVRTWEDERGRTLAALQFEKLSDAGQSALVRYCNAAERMVIERRMAVRTTVELPVTIELAGTLVARDPKDIRARLDRADTREALARVYHVRFDKSSIDAQCSCSKPGRSHESCHMTPHRAAVRGLGLCMT